MNTEFSLNPKQTEAVNKIEHWYHKGQQPYFNLGGYAGTGKTTCVQTILSMIGAVTRRDAALCAYTAKAANVLKTKSACIASTIHSLIYRYKDQKALDAVKLRLAELRKTARSDDRDEQIIEVIKEIEHLSAAAKGKEFQKRGGRRSQTTAAQKGANRLEPPENPESA